MTEREKEKKPADESLRPIWLLRRAPPVPAAAACRRSEHDRSPSPTAQPTAPRVFESAAVAPRVWALPPPRSLLAIGDGNARARAKAKVRLAAPTVAPTATTRRSCWLLRAGTAHAHAPAVAAGGGCGASSRRRRGRRTRGTATVSVRDDGDTDRNRPGASDRTRKDAARLAEEEAGGLHRQRSRPAQSSPEEEAQVAELDAPRPAPATRTTTLDERKSQSTPRGNADAASGGAVGHDGRNEVARLSWSSND